MYSSVAIYQACVCAYVSIRRVFVPIMSVYAYVSIAACVYMCFHVSMRCVRVCACVSTCLSGVCASIWSVACV